MVLKIRIVVGLVAAAAGLILSSAPAPAAPAADGFLVSKAQYNTMFPNHKPFYSYADLVKAMRRFPAFATTGTTTTRRREAAAFLAHVSHETSGGRYIVEQNEANYPHYCDLGRPYGCPAGRAAYFGRGPIQLSWNYNYKAAGDALGIDLLRHPAKVAGNSVVAWKTGLWYWTTQSGATAATPHRAMVAGAGFGQTIRAVNGMECDGGNPAQVADRVARYKRFARILGVSPGRDLSC